jgi:hypothetical protein
VGRNKKKPNNVARIAPREASLKRRVRRHLRALGFHKSSDGGFQIDGTDKDKIRAIHNHHRNGRVASNQRFLDAHYHRLIHHFASGDEVDPGQIRPVLERVSAETEESDLFRLASLTWSVPVSNGFGRRLRYLVRDKSNNKLIGLIAIGDPVYNLAVRDNLIGWDIHDRSERLVNIMDAYVLGALPPYNMLLGGKLVASLVRTRDIYDDFAEAYGDTTGIISKKDKRARLLAVTTSSSLGRSSVYNRLKLEGVEYFKSIGYTGGWGHFHIPDGLFDDLREYLRSIDHPYADHHQFGQGPNWRMRTTRAALAALGLKEDVLKHGIQREVFMCELASNAGAILRGGKAKPNLSTLLSAREVAALALKRWIVPRAERRSEFRVWNADGIATLLKQHSAKIKLAAASGR